MDPSQSQSMSKWCKEVRILINLLIDWFCHLGNWCVLFYWFCTCWIPCPVSFTIGTSLMLKYCSKLFSKFKICFTDIWWMLRLLSSFLHKEKTLITSEEHLPQFFFFFLASAAYFWNFKQTVPAAKESFLPCCATIIVHLQPKQKQVYLIIAIWKREFQK